MVGDVNRRKGASHLFARSYLSTSMELYRCFREWKFIIYLYNSQQPNAWTTTPPIPSALVSILLRLANIKFVIATLGDKGCIMLERSINEASEMEETNVESLFQLLRQKVDRNATILTCISFKVYFCQTT
ncbi:uncharacterized protein [Elaeis guineensis]|uniref:uncharacterized protein isoform X1 n=2 Tax=Elaeis guineensis var. tenera TaxID=51953 RepID=UPI003C6D26D2